MSICHRTVNHKKIWNAPLYTLMCPLQIINDIKPLSSTLHGVNVCFIHHLSNVKNYSISHKSETDQPKQKKVSWRIYFYTFILVLDLKIKKQMAENLDWTFLISVKSALNGPANGSEVTYLKIQNRLSRAPRLHLWTDSWCNTSIISVLYSFVKVSKKWYSTFDGL